MSDETAQPENETAAEETKPPFQFSIKSLMILTAAVAAYFALATQAPKETTVTATVVLIYFSFIAFILRIVQD